MLKKFALFSLALAVAMAVFAAPTPAAAQGNPRNPRNALDLARRVMQTALEVVTTQTGLARADLLKQFAEGKSLTEIITAAGKDAKAIQAEIEKAVTDEIKQAVADGKLSKVMADRLLANVSEAVTRLMTATPKQRTGRDLQNLKNVVLQAAVTGALVQETARAGNMLPREVLQALRNDKSLNDVIKEKGLDAAKITAAVTQTVTDGVNRRVKDGKLTQAQADALLAELPTLITETLAKTDWASLRGALGGRRNK